MEILKSLILGLPEDLERIIAFGDFEEANKLIDIYMKRNISNLLKERLKFEKHRMKRLKREYVYSYDEALTICCQTIKDFNKEELEFLKNERYADWIYINGQVTFHRRFLDTIIRTNNNIHSRVFEKDNDRKKEEENKFLDRIIDEIMKYGEKEFFIHLKTGIKIKNHPSKIGQTIKVHVPIPKNAQQIKEIKIIETFPEVKLISEKDYSQRTVYFEKKATEEDNFTVEYSYKNHVKYRKLNKDEVSQETPNFYKEELYPHIRFTPYLIDITKEIIGEEKNPLVKARKIYDYITQNVQYSFMREYIAITNIPEYAAYNLKGDCGVQALLFITLCRIANIPARWQSGLHVNPYFIGCHDWAEFYIEPYGWLFADLSFGARAYREGSMKRWNFYFGNLDPFRMVANSDFQQELLPKKQFLRIDPYDNQIGEAEYLDEGIYEIDPILEIMDIYEI